MSYTIRSAVAVDQRTIVQLIRAAHINPVGLKWPRFLVAESGGQLIGTIQVKPHLDGSRELASLAVAPMWQRKGIGSALITAVLRRAVPPLYLTCGDRLEHYYARFGFRRVEPLALPHDLGRIYVAGNIVLSLASERQRLLVLRWEGNFYHNVLDTEFF